MTAGAPRARRRAPRTGGGTVVNLEQARIQRALAARKRYKYVRPRVLREGAGWKVASPNCSRSIDPQGGEVDIAWLVPTPQGRWQLFARDHARGCWQLRAEGLALDAALARLCEDPQREFWQ